MTAEDPSVIRYRHTPRQFVVSSVVPAVLLLVVGAGVRGLAGSVMVGLGLGLAGVGAQRGRTGAAVRDDARVVRLAARTQAVPWADIEKIDVTQQGSRKVVLVETAERLFRLPAPYDSRVLADPDFERKARAIADRWRAKR